MIKNTAGQKIGAELIAANDGTAFTSQVTVYVTGDAGAQGLGATGSGLCTHEGNGYHTYAPSQAETNFDLAAFTFIGTGAVPQTVQVYTRATTPDVNVASMSADTLTATALAASAVTEIQSGLSTLNAAGIRAAVGLASADLDTQLDALDVSLAAVKLHTDNLPEGVSRNVNLANFGFFMALSSNHYSPATGLTVAAQRSIDGAAFGDCANAVGEIGSGVYKIDLDATDLNGTVIVLKFTAATADTRIITIKTETP